MKRLFLILVLIGGMNSLPAQVAFKTMVTQGPVIAGESFQVQYVLDNIGSEDEFFQPDFKNFKFVSGPNFYDASAYGADGPKKLKNVVYTLAALKAGKFIVPGASARINGQITRSDNALVEVISKADAIARGILLDIPKPDGEYSLEPGEDPYDKIRRNLFLKILVDKKECYVGQPITATFKLYSRVKSKSDIVKNPGLYGFTVQDMIGLNDNLTANERINGKSFDVHTLRKVQLYPLRPGSFTIDAMEVENKIDFSKSAVSRKTEQEIIEGIVPETGEYKNTNGIYETSISTVPVTIHVKPVPTKGKPQDYNGATGKFSLTAMVLRSELAKNEEGDLIVTIKGKGNFTQLSAPVIQWPDGIEGFDPVVADSLDHTQAPLKGTRVFRFRFISSKAGTYLLPATSFTFFDPDSNSYKTAASPAITVIINNRASVQPRLNKRKEDGFAGRTGNRVVWIGAALLLTLVAGAAIIYRRRKKNDKTAVLPQKEKVAIRATDMLRPAITLSEASDKTFYTVLRRCIWDFFTPYLGLVGSAMNKNSLSAALEERNIGKDSRHEVLDILRQCETGMFTDADIAGDRTLLLETTKHLLETVGKQLDGQ